MTINTILAKLGRDRLFWLIIGAILLVYAVLEFGALVPLLFGLFSLVVAITVHECAHAWAANELGDPTARYLGRISLNPIRHLDPLGTVMILITTLTGYGIGWGKPVPVTPYRLRYGSRLGGALVSFAGPASNLLTALVIGIIARLAAPLLPQTPYVMHLLRALILTNLVIAFFNLIPIPPLDGHSVLVGLISLIHAEWAYRIVQWLDGLQRFGQMLLLGLIIISQLLGLGLIGIIIGAPVGLLYRLIMGPLA